MYLEKAEPTKKDKRTISVKASPKNDKMYVVGEKPFIEVDKTDVD